MPTKFFLLKKKYQKKIKIKNVHHCKINTVIPPIGIQKIFMEGMMNHLHHHTYSYATVILPYVTTYGVARRCDINLSFGNVRHSVSMTRCIAKILRMTSNLRTFRTII